MHPEAEDTTRKSWRRVALVAFGVGAGAAATLLLCFGLWFWYESRPVPWGTRALTASDVAVGDSGWKTVSGAQAFQATKSLTDADIAAFDKQSRQKNTSAPPDTLPPDFFDKRKTVEDLGKLVKKKYPGSYDSLSDIEVGRRAKAKYPQYSQFADVGGTFGGIPVGDETDAKPKEPVSLELTFNLQNNTSRDLTIPKGVTIMKRDAQTNALEAAPELTWDGAPFIPAKQKVKVSIPLIYCPSGNVDSCLGEHYRQGEKLVIFDHADRIEIEVPIPILRR